MNKYDLELRRKISKKLREEMNTAEPSQPTGQTEEDYKMIIDHITEQEPKCIVEYGSGFSTRHIQKTINELGLATKFFSFDDNKYYYDIIKEHIELTDAVELVPFEKHSYTGHKDQLGRYYHSYEGMEEVDFVIIDGPDVGRYNICATTNIVDLHERFPNNKISVFIQGRISTTEYYIELYGDKFKIIGKNGWGEL